MSENMTQGQESNVHETTAVPPHVQTACNIATGKVSADPAAEAISIVGAKKDLNSKGRGPEWYRMVWRNGVWQYVSSDRLPRGNFLASDRRASVYGDVFVGEVIVGHDRGAKVDCAYLVVDGETALTALALPKPRRDGSLAIKLPDGSELVLPNPRK